MASKLVSLRLVGLTYSGESIGNDITVEVEAADRSLSIKKKVSAGQSIALKEFVGSFVTTQRSFSVPVTLRVIETDRVFNDVGSTNALLRVDLADSAAQRFAYSVEVKERSAILRANAAVFEVALEARVMPTTRYVVDKGDGWVRIILAGGRKEYLATTTRVELSATDEKREYFTVMEGHYRGQQASVTLGEHGSSYLDADNPQLGPARLTYHILTRTLVFQGQSYKTKDYPRRPWSKGTYDVEILDYPHRANYPGIQYAKTWFRIGHAGDRYLHTGGASLGCVTVTDRDRWDALRAVLVRSRKGDGMSIGSLEVVS